MAAITITYIILALIGVLFLGGFMWIAVLLEFFHGHFLKAMVIILLIVFFGGSNNDHRRNA